LCPSPKYTTFVLGEFEVFRRNLENVAKVPVDTGGSKGVKGFLSGVLTKVDYVDQKGSLGFVGDVFEVMAQVDRRLTKVNTVDRIIRVN
jgi:hypothetical protein